MNETKADSFIGSLISLDSLEQTIRVNKCKSMISNFQIEQGKKDDITKKMGEVKISEMKAEEGSLETTTLETLITGNQKECPLSLEQISKIPIIELPGSLQPIPTRPIFFDIL